MADRNVSLEEEILVNAENALVAIDSLKKSIKGLKTETSSVGDAIKKGFQAIGITFSMRKLLGFLKEANNDAMDLIETTNLFEVSFGKGIEGLNQYYEKAIKFQNQLSEALGTNINESMNFQALFNAMGKSMGLDDAVAYTISENFTKLGYDLASLYNTETDKAMQKLQSGLSGSSTRPLRSFGIDITQATLSNTLADLGIDKTIGQLNQAEKMVLRYISVVKQASIAHGDFARTLESPANQLRIFQAQILSLKQNIGSLWQGVLQQWMPYINAMLMVINALIRALASFFGIKVSSSIGKISSGIEGASAGAGGLSDNLDKAGGSAKKLAETLDLMPWDEIHNIDLAKDTSGGGSGGISGGGGGASIDQGLLDAMMEYDNLMSQVENKATQIRDKIMDWLGFTKIINEKTGEIEWKLREGYQKIELIRDILVGIVGGVLFTKMKKLIDKVGGLGEALAGLKNFAGNMLISIGVATEFFGIKDNDMLEKLVGILEISAGAGLKWGLKGGVIALGVSAVVTLAISGLKWTYENKDHAIDQMFGGKKNLNLMENIDAESYAWWSGFMKELGGAMGYSPEEVQQGWDEYWNTFRTNFSAFSAEMDIKIAEFETKWKNFTDTVTNKENWQNYWEDVKTGAENWKNDMGTKWENLKTTIGTKMEELKTNGTNTWNTFKENLKTKTDEIKTNVSTKFTEIKTNIGEKIGEIKTNAMKKWDEIKDGIKEKIEWARDRVEEAINKIKSFFNFEWKLPDIKTPHFEVSYDTSGFMAKTFSSMGLPGKPEIHVNWYAQGGFPEMGELFMAREAGPELVGTMGGRTAVANNDQIIEGIKAGVYEAVASAMSNYGGVQIEAKIEEGILLKKVQNQATQYRMQTGKAPFPTM